MITITKKVSYLFVLIFINIHYVFSQSNTPCGAPSIDIGISCVNTIGTTVGATYQSNAANGGTPSCASPGSPDVWYSFVAPAGGSIILTTSSGTITDGGMALYSGACGALTQLSCDDDDGAGLMPYITQSGLTPGATYYIRFWEYSSGTGTFSLCITTPPINGSCSGAQAFCTSSGTSFPGSVGTTAEAGPNYGCLDEQPSPAWFYLNIATSGSIQIELTNSEDNDIDFALWGPFSSETAMCTGTNSPPIDCSYSGASNEQAFIPSANAGEWYILLITNYDDSPTEIYASGTGSTGSTNCDILCNMTSLTAIPDTCIPTTNTYSVSGVISFQYPPSSGTLVISNTCGGSVSIPPPWTSPVNYTLTGIPSNGATCNITAIFSGDSTCSLTTPYVSPTSCNPCSVAAINNGPVCQGELFDLTSTNVPTATYSWTGPNGFSSTLQNPTNVGLGLPSGIYTYTVTVTAETTCTDSTLVTVNSPPTATFETVQATCNTSNDGMLIATGISPNGPFVYEFYDSTGTNLIQTNTTLTSDTLFNISSGAYLVTITDGNGCEVDTLVNVQPATEILITNVSNDTTICINNSTTLNFGAVGGTGPLTYIWDNGLIGGGPHVVTPLSNTTYTVFAQDVNGCTSLPASINVVVNPNATIALTSAIPTASQTVCINSVITPIEYTIGGGGTGTTVTGLPNGVSGNFLAGVMSITGTPSDTGTFNYLVTTIGSCSQVVDSGSITITPDATLTLTSGNQLQTVCINSPIANITYAVGGGGTNASVTGLPSGLTSSYNAGVFTISGTPTSIGTFNYTVTTSGTCLQTSLNGTLTLNDSLHITTLNLSRDSICPNDTTSISINPATGGSGIGYTYNWFDNNNNAVGTGLNITVSPTSSPTTYTVVVGDNCTTPTVTQSVTVYWLPLPQPSFIANNTSGCYPILTLFTNTTPNSTNINNVTWNFGDGGISNDILNTSHLYSSPGCFDVSLTVTSIDGCVRDTSIQDFACAYDYPIADFMMDPQPTDITNPYINFTNQSLGNTDNYWSFTSGIPNVSFETDPQAEFPADTAGTYLVELAVSNSYGCTDTIQKEVVINGLYLFYAPNAFTPNGDGNNDYFIPTGDGVDWTKYNLMIFDRWGEKLFETSDIMQGWDGTFNGTPVQTGVYVWKVKAKEFYRNIKTEHSGHVNLLR